MSIQDDAPIYKFLFVKGSDEYRYTSAAYFIADSAETWEPAAITASVIQQTGELSKNSVKLTLPRTNPVALLFLGQVPEETVSLTIYRENGSLFTVEWKGRVAFSEAANDTVTLECEDIFTSMRRSGLRAKYQKGCRHALYSDQCGVHDYDFAVPAEIVSASGFTVTIANLGDSSADSSLDVSDDGYFVGGIIETDAGVRRYILEQSGLNLTLLSPFNGLDVDSVALGVTLYPGCNHQTSDCKDKFNNLLNYGGFPFIPGKNPFSGSVQGSIV